jgi:hypothetical protein
MRSFNFNPSWFSLTSLIAVITQSVYRLGYGLDDWGPDPGRGWEFFSSPPCPDRLWDPTQTPIHWIRGAVSLGIKQPGRKSDHSPPSSVKVKNAWSYTATPQYVFMAWCLVKNRDNFKFTFTLFGLHILKQSLKAVVIKCLPFPNTSWIFRNGN